METARGPRLRFHGDSILCCRESGRTEARSGSPNGGWPQTAANGMTRDTRHTRGEWHGSRAQIAAEAALSGSESVTTVWTGGELPADQAVKTPTEPALIANANASC